MKARVKATGNIIEVIPYSGFDDYDYYEPEEKMPWLKEELVFAVTDKDDTYNKGRQAGWDEADPDYWEKLKHQYAGMAMQGILANRNHYAELFPNQIASDAYKYATALVKKLKEASV